MNPDHNLDHAISAASLVLAVLAALYTLWLGDVGRIMAIEADVDKDNRELQKRAVTWTLVTKGLSLTFASGAAVAIMGPRTVAIVSQAMAHGHDWEFNDVKAFFVLTAVLLVVVFLVATGQAVRLLAKRFDLNR